MSNKDGGLDSQDKQVYFIHNYSLSFLLLLLLLLKVELWKVKKLIKSLQAARGIVSYINTNTNANTYTDTNTNRQWYKYDIFNHTTKGSSFTY